MALPVVITGRVIQGYRTARSSGFPTANLDVEGKMPDLLHGTYYGYTRIGIDEVRYKSVIFFGIPYSISHDAMPHFEVHILDADFDLYGKVLVVELTHFARANQEFENDTDLFAAIQKDFSNAKMYFSQEP